MLGVRTDCQLSFVNGTTLLAAAFAAVEATGADAALGMYDLAFSNHDCRFSPSGFCCWAAMVRGRMARSEAVRRMLAVFELRSFRTLFLEEGFDSRLYLGALGSEGQDGEVSYD